MAPGPVEHWLGAKAEGAVDGLDRFASGTTVAPPRCPTPGPHPGSAVTDPQGVVQLQLIWRWELCARPAEPDA